MTIQTTETATTTTNRCGSDRCLTLIDSYGLLGYSRADGFQQCCRTAVWSMYSLYGVGKRTRRPPSNQVMSASQYDRHHGDGMGFYFGMPDCRSDQGFGMVYPVLGKSVMQLYDIANREWDAPMLDAKPAITLQTDDSLLEHWTVKCELY